MEGLVIRNRIALVRGTISTAVAEVVMELARGGVISHIVIADRLEKDKLEILQEQLSKETPHTPTLEKLLDGLMPFHQIENVRQPDLVNLIEDHSFHKVKKEQPWIRKRRRRGWEG